MQHEKQYQEEVIKRCDTYSCTYLMSVCLFCFISLGLVISEKLLQAQGGTSIEVKSTLGVGSEFSFSLNVQANPTNKVLSAPLTLPDTLSDRKRKISSVVGSPPSTSTPPSFSSRVPEAAGAAAAASSIPLRLADSSAAVSEIPATRSAAGFSRPIDMSVPDLYSISPADRNVLQTIRVVWVGESSPWITLLKAYTGEVTITKDLSQLRALLSCESSFSPFLLFSCDSLEIEEETVLATAGRDVPTLFLTTGVRHAVAYAPSDPRIYSMTEVSSLALNTYPENAAGVAREVEKADTAMETEESAMTNEENGGVHQAPQLPYVDHLSKPFRGRTLLQRISHLARMFMSTGVSASVVSTAHSSRNEHTSITHAHLGFRSAAASSTASSASAVAGRPGTIRAIAGQYPLRILLSVLKRTTTQ